MTFNSKGSEGRGSVNPTMAQLAAMINNPSPTFQNSASNMPLDSAMAENPLLQATDMYTTLLNFASGHPGGIAGGPAMDIAPQTTIDAKPQPKPGDPFLAMMLDQYQNQLGAANSIDYESALQQSQAAIKDAYAAQIAALRSNNGAARKQTAKDRKDVEAMYAALSKSYNNMAGREPHIGHQNAQAMINTAAASNKQIANYQNQQSAQEAKLLEGLGMQDTAKQIIPNSFKTTDKAVANNNRYGNRHATQARETAHANQQFFLRGGQNALLAGDNRSADLLAALENYLRQNQDQIGVLKGKRGQELAQNKLAVQGSVAKQQQQDTTAAWNMLQDIAKYKQGKQQANITNNLNAKKFGLDQQKFAASQASGGSSKSSSGFDKGMNNAYSVVSQADHPKQVASILNSLFDSFGKPGYAMPTKFQAMAQAEAVGKKAGLTGKDLQILKQAAASSLG